MERKNNGLVQVIYGIHDREEDGGKGYTYNSNGLHLEVGDIVLVPSNWLNPKPQEATVVSTYSDYDGEVSDILCLLIRRRTTLEKLRRDKPTTAKPDAPEED